MAASDERFKHESLEDPETIVKYLTALMEGFQSGSLAFESDGKSLVLRPNGLIRLEVEARRKNEDARVTIKFRWTEEPASAEDKALFRPKSGIE